MYISGENMYCIVDIGLYDNLWEAILVILSGRSYYPEEFYVVLFNEMSKGDWSY